MTAPDKHHEASKGKRQRDRFTPRFPKFNQVLRRLGINLSWHSILERADIFNFIPQSQKQRILRELTIRPMFPVFHANSQATLSYIPKTYPNRITLFRTSVQASRADHDSTMGWSELTVQGVEVHIVPGNHLTMLRNPNVQAFAEQLKVCFEAEQALYFGNDRTKTNPKEGA